MHQMLYVLMMWIPLTGWLLLFVSTENFPFKFLGIFQWPELQVSGLLPRNAVNENVMRIFHVYGAWIISASVLAHVLGALHHRFVHRDGILSRMLPARPVQARAQARRLNRET